MSDEPGGDFGAAWGAALATLDDVETRPAATGFPAAGPPAHPGRGHRRGGRAQRLRSHPAGAAAAAHVGRSSRSGAGPPSRPRGQRGAVRRRAHHDAPLPRRSADSRHSGQCSARQRGAHLRTPCRTRRHQAPGDRAVPAQSALRLRHIRHRLEQPLRPRRCSRRGRSTGQGLQPIVDLRRLRSGKDPPSARDRPLCPHHLPGYQGSLRELGRVHQRLHQFHQRRQGFGVPASISRRRRPSHRRHPVPRGQDPDAGGVLPHLQHAAQRDQADRHYLRPAAQAALGAGGPASQSIRMGSDL